MTSTGQRSTSTSRSSAERKQPGTIAIGVSQVVIVAQSVWAWLRPWHGWRWLGSAGALLFVVALPVTLVGANVRILFTSSPLYTFSVEQYRVPSVTNIPRTEIDRAMAEIRDYFTNSQQLLRITVVDERGRSNPLFTPREVIHMQDVKHLVQSIFRLQIAASLYVVGYVCVRLLMERRAAWAGLARLTRTSALATVAIVAGFGVATLLGFDRLFEQFHVLSFSNDFWQLDPGQDRLVQMFPFDFWLVSTIILVGMTLVQVLALLALSWWYLQRFAHRSPVQPAADTPVAASV